MRRFVCLFAVLSAGLLVLPGCGSDEIQDTPTEPRVGQAGKAGKKAPKAVEFVEAPTTGVIRGKVILATEPPTMKEISSMAAHNDRAVCMAGPEREKMDQSWMVDAKTKGVANVFIKLVPPAGKKFKEVEPETSEVVIDQPHCAYVPHVVVVKPKQNLKVLNSSGANHNTKIETDPSVQESQNLNIPPKDSRVVPLKAQRNPVNLSCQVHSWMSAKVYVPDHSYAVVTKDDGSFEIANVPIGVEVTIVGLHEDGDVEGGKEGTKRTFVAGDNEVSLKISAKK